MYFTSFIRSDSTAARNATYASLFKLYKHQKKGREASYCDAIKYLHEMYTKDHAITVADCDIICFKNPGQIPNEVRPSSIENGSSMPQSI